jgi:serine/threonine protein kinase
MWSSLYALEKLDKYRSVNSKKRKDEGKQPLSVSLPLSIKDEIINASSEDELNKLIEIAKKNNIDVVEILEEAISSGRIYADLVTEYTNKLNYEKMYEKVATMLYKIGKGTYGVVYKVSDNEVVKENKKVLKEENEVLNELVNLKHANILSVFFILGERTLYEFVCCTNVSNPEPKLVELFDLVEESRLNHQKRLYLVYQNNIMQQLFDGIQFLHSKNIVHRDLKPENVMVGGVIPNSIVVKIIDFNLSLFLEKNSILPPNIAEPGLVGSPTYVSPMFKNFSEYRKIQTDQGLETITSILKLSDMWSFVMICWTLIYGGHAWEYPYITYDSMFLEYIQNQNKEIFIDKTYKNFISKILGDYDPNFYLSKILNLLWEFSVSNNKVYLTNKNSASFYSKLREFLNVSYELKFSTVL